MIDRDEDQKEPFELSHSNPQDLSGADATDTHGSRSDKRPGARKPDSDQTSVDIVDEDSIATTADGGLAVAGGKLPGNKDSFDGELDDQVKPVPGANTDNQVVPPNARDLRM